MGGGSTSSGGCKMGEQGEEWEGFCWWEIGMKNSRFTRQSLPATQSALAFLCCLGVQARSTRVGRAFEGLQTPVVARTPVPLPSITGYCLSCLFGHDSGDW